MSILFNLVIFVNMDKIVNGLGTVCVILWFFLLKNIIFYFKKMSMCQVHIMSRVILWFFLTFSFKKNHVSSQYHVTCQSQLFIFKLVIIFVIFFQFSSIFFNLTFLFLSKLRKKFNLYINVIYKFNKNIHITFI